MDSPLKAIPAPGIIHCDFYNEYGVDESANIPINKGLNIFDITQYLPSGLHSVYPKAGWVDIRTSDVGGGNFDANRSWFGYS